LKGFSFGRTRGIVEHRLVLGFSEIEIGVMHKKDFLKIMLQN
jgi:hypothetical protein